MNTSHLELRYRKGNVTEITKKVSIFGNEMNSLSIFQYKQGQIHNRITLKHHATIPQSSYLNWIFVSPSIHTDKAETFLPEHWNNKFNYRQRSNQALPLKMGAQQKYEYLKSKNYIRNSNNTLPVTITPL